MKLNCIIRVYVKILITDISAVVPLNIHINVIIYIFIIYGKTYQCEFVSAECAFLVCIYTYRTLIVART